MISCVRIAISRLPRVLAWLCLALVLCVSSAWAHASLNASEPQDGVVVASPPAGFSLTFSEPVSPLTMRLVRPDGSSSALDRVDVKGNAVNIAAPGGLGRGTHVLSWRVVSADGHPIGGSMVFSIGEASTRTPAVEEQVDWTVRGLLWFSKVLLYAGLFIGVGGVFAVRILMPGIAAGTPLVIAALALGMAGATASAGFQGLDALGAPAGRLLDPAIWSAGMGTSYGMTVGAALLVFLVAALALALPGIAGGVAAAAALAAAGTALALSGHASAASPQWLMRPAVFLHAVAIAVWIGALAPLGLSLKHADAGAITALRRFSRAIPAFVAVLIMSGSVLAVVQVQHPLALFGTAYGQVFLAKLALLVGLFVLASVNRWTLTGGAGAGDGPATRRLVRSIGVETVLALAIFAVAATWRFTPPPRVLAAEAARPATVQLQSAKATVVFWVGPARAGPVDVVANVLDPEFGPMEPKEVSVTLSNPGAGIEPFRRKLVRGGGMADWHASAVTVPVAGLWRVRVDVLISDFEIARLDGEIRIRP